MGVGSSPFTGPVEVRSWAVKPAVSSMAGCSRAGLRSVRAAAASPDAIWEPHACQSDRDSAHGSSARYGQDVVLPADIGATPRASRLNASPAVTAPGPPADT